MSIAGLIAHALGQAAGAGPPPLRLRQTAGGAGGTIDCACCPAGGGLEDPACRSCVLRALAGHGEIASLTLERDLVREYTGESVSRLQQLASIYSDLQLQAASFRSYGCGRCDAGRRKGLQQAIADAAALPEGVDRRLELLLDEQPLAPGPGCIRCREAFRAFVDDLALLAGRLQEAAGHTFIPFIRPRFSQSCIWGPPDGAQFLAAYEVEPPGPGLPLHVGLYELPGSLEKMYCAEPWEYAMGSDDLALVISARDRLLRRRPAEGEYPDLNGARAFFARHAREAIASAASARGERLEVARLDRLAAAFVKYTAGLGVLEDVLADPHIQDAYVNAPVGATPLHVVVDGEEHTSNIYLSSGDVESLISRLRAISGRPFSEASPVLDMDLGEFRTRVSVIGSPLSRGLAYAFRRHKRTPWTLPQLIRRRMLTPYAAGLLSLLVDGHASLLVTGSRGAGKTSLLSALMLEIPQSYRILAIEDTAELPLEDLQRCGWKVQGISTRAAIAGAGAELQASDALRAALRLGDSALVLGEVRGPEAKVLYEAMRVGASGNAVLGTIHGASCRDVLERVVHDIGVPAASFRATDAVAVCSTVRPGGSSVRERRLLEIAEVSKSAREDEPEGAFRELLAYDAGTDALLSAGLIETGRSEALGAIARRWGLSMEETGATAAARGRMLEILAEAGGRRPELLEAPGYARCANMYRLLCADKRGPEGGLRAWEEWLASHGAGTA